MITVQKARELTGLKTSTICKWAKKRNQPMLGKGMYLLNEKFINFLKTRVKPRRRRKIIH